MTSQPRTITLRGRTLGLALGKQNGRANPAHDGAERVIRGESERGRLTAVWFRYGRVWVVRP